MKFVLTKASGAPKAKLSYLCPWCRVPTSSETSELFASQGTRSFHIIACGHATCGKPAMIGVQTGLNISWPLLAHTHPFTVDIYPPPLPEYSGDGVPPKIARDFTEALQCQASGFLFGAALVGRRVLQAAVRDKGGVGKDLKAEIDSLPSNLLSDPYKERAHEVRFVGNDAAHADEVTEDEVEDLIDFARQVLHELYVGPEQLRRSKERRKAKKAEKQ